MKLLLKDPNKISLSLFCLSILLISIAQNITNSNITKNSNSQEIFLTNQYKDRQLNYIALQQNVLVN